jgi:transposase
VSTTTVDRYAGVDVSKARLDVAVRPTGERYSVANEPKVIDTLVGRLREAGPALAVLEATGGFDRPTAAALAASDGQRPVDDAARRATFKGSSAA